jgi:hypothetical protein
MLVQDFTMDGGARQGDRRLEWVGLHIGGRRTATSLQKPDAPSVLSPIGSRLEGAALFYSCGPSRPRYRTPPLLWGLIFGSDEMDHACGLPLRSASIAAMNRPSPSDDGSFSAGC